MRKYCKTKQHSVDGIRKTTYIIEEDKCKDWIKRAEPDEIAPKTEEELKDEEDRKKIDAIDDDYKCV